MIDKSLLSFHYHLSHLSHPYNLFITFIPCHPYYARTSSTLPLILASSCHRLTYCHSRFSHQPLSHVHSSTILYLPCPLSSTPRPQHRYKTYHPITTLTSLSPPYHLLINLFPLFPFSHLTLSFLHRHIWLTSLIVLSTIFEQHICILMHFPHLPLSFLSPYHLLTLITPITSLPPPYHLLITPLSPLSPPFPLLPLDIFPLDRPFCVFFLFFLPISFNYKVTVLMILSRILWLVLSPYHPSHPYHRLITLTTLSPSSLFAFSPHHRPVWNYSGLYVATIFCRTSWFLILPVSTYDNHHAYHPYHPYHLVPLSGCVTRFAFLSISSYFGSSFPCIAMLTHTVRLCSQYNTHTTPYHL